VELLTTKFYNLHILQAYTFIPS